MTSLGKDIIRDIANNKEDLEPLNNRLPKLTLKDLSEDTQLNPTRENTSNEISLPKDFNPNLDVHPPTPPVIIPKVFFEK